jgi:DNA processing protein
LLWTLLSLECDLVFPVFIMLYISAVHAALNLTHNRYRALTAFFGEDNWETIWNASLKDLAAARLDKKGIERFLTRKKKIEPKKITDKLRSVDAKVMTIGDVGYPLNLKHIYNPPAILFYRGDWDDSWLPGLAVVGSRKITSYGKRALEKILTPVVQAGVTIISGLAYGTDFLAHELAINNNGKTIAVLGNSIDSVYPSSFANFAQNIVESKQGIIFSEYAPGTPTNPEHFPQRNRIVAGLAKSVLIIEAAEKSGSLITGTLGLEQGKDVFAVPGDVFSNQSKGTNGLIVRGEAQACVSGKALLEQLGLAPKSVVQTSMRTALPLSESERNILELLQIANTLHLDDLGRQATMTSPEISAQISLLELKGLVKHLGRQVYGLV